MKRAREEGGGHGAKTGARSGGAKRARGVAFGTGALEETDTFGYMEDYVTAEGGACKEGFNFEIASDDEDGDAPGRWDLSKLTPFHISVSQAP